VRLLSVTKHVQKLPIILCTLPHQHSYQMFVAIVERFLDADVLDVPVTENFGREQATDEAAVWVDVLDQVAVVTSKNIAVLW